MTIIPGEILKTINSPADLKKLNETQLVQLSRELRNYIIDEVSCNPGHFGASLGVVELTVALHYVLNTPHDNIIWDVGHQAYGHKILTGRRDSFHTNRKYGGISGFPNRKESEYDSFGTGHSSTSISAAIGMAVAAEKQGVKKDVVAVIGDGAMTGGMAFEGLNNAAMNNTDVLVVLNDNNMAIDPSAGAMKEYLVDIATSKTYNKVKNDVWRFLGKVSKFGPDAQGIAQKIDNGIKSIVLKQSNMFEALKFRYFGPVDGHDVVHLTKVLADLKRIKGPKLLHVITKKGKGFKQAELNQTVWHAPPGNFDRKTGEIFTVKNNTPKPLKYQEIFGHTIIELAEKNDKIVGITPAMPSGSSLNLMMEKMPDRAFDVGIAEQHAVTFAAGLAAEGMLPFCNIYSTFMQRAYDQIIHDVALQKLDVVLCLDRAGLVGQDGATHHGVFDIAYLRCIPNVIIASPMNETEMRNMMFTAQLPGNGTFALRYPRGVGIQTNWKTPFEKLVIGKGRCVREGDDLAIISFGPTGNIALTAVETAQKQGINAAVYDLRFAKPIDEDLLHEVFQKFNQIITVEDGTVIGGVGSAILEFKNDHDYTAKVQRLGVPDKFIEHGTQQELKRDCGFDKEGILSAIKNAVTKAVKQAR